MPIAKKSSTAPKGATKSKSNTPHLGLKDVGITAPKAKALHSLIEQVKQVASDLKEDPTKMEILDVARRKIFEERAGSFYVDIAKGLSLLIKPSSRRYPLSDEAAERIEEIVENAGYDAGDFYHESHEIKMDADSIYERLGGDDEYEQFQADLAEFMHDRKLGDCWEMKSSIIQKPDANRHGLPVEVNMEIEKVKPMTIAVEAKRTI